MVVMCKSYMLETVNQYCKNKNGCEHNYIFINWKTINGKITKLVSYP